MSFDPDFPLCGIFAKMLICLYEYTLRNLFSNFLVSMYVFPVCPISIFSKVLVWPHFNWLFNYHTFTNLFDEPDFLSNRHIYNSTNEVGGRDVMLNSLRFRLFVCRPCTMSERKFKIALYVEYKTWQCNFSFNSLAATILTFILEAQPYNSQKLSYCDYYISYSPSISLGRALKFIAMRIIIPWFAAHSVFFFIIIMNSLVFVTFCCFEMTKLSKIKGMVFSDFTFRNCHTHVPYLRPEARQFWQDRNAHNIIFRHFTIKHFNLWASLVSWISICAEHISRHTRSWSPY